LEIRKEESGVFIRSALHIACDREILSLHCFGR